MHCPSSNANFGSQSSLIDAHADRVYEKLKQTFENAIPDDICRALETLVSIYHLPDTIPPPTSYKLFHMVMQSPVPETHSEMKWEVSRLTMHGAFEENKPLPPVEDPNDILAFLDHHFELVITRGQNHDQPIQDALHALASASSPVIIEALNRFDVTGRLFIRGICRAFQGDRPSKLREAALLFLPHISSIWFHPCALIMGSTDMSSFCMDWASAVDRVELTPTVQEAVLTVLLGMINSPYWRPHIVPEKWSLLEHFTSVLRDPPSLRVCINNPDLMDEVRNVANPRATVLWVEILWFKYDELIPEVRERLEAVTMDIARNERGTHLGTSQSHIGKYLSNTNSELKKAEDALRRCASSPADPGTVTLRERVGMLQRASRDLDSIRLGGTLKRVLEVDNIDGV